MIMILWFIRHAIAVERSDFAGPDLARPLTAAGRRQAREMFERLARFRAGPTLIFASEAVRAWETADLLSVCYRLNRPVRTPLLNPGCTLKRLGVLLASKAGPAGHVALVGHEPDFSELISRLTADRKQSLKMKKGALAEVELKPGNRGILKLLIPPDVMAS